MMIAHDARCAWRMWRAYPLVTAAALLSLALGIGANTAVFSVLNAVLLSAAPVGDPGTLFSIYSTNAANPGLHGTSFQNYEHLRASLPFEVAAYAPVLVGISGAEREPEQIPAELVSDNYFRVLRVGAARGRTFAVGEGRVVGGPPVVVISDALWRRRFGARPDIIGQNTIINTRPFTIVGVAPRGFGSIDVTRAVDVWIVSSVHQDVLTGVQAFYFRQRFVGMFDLVTRAGAPSTRAQLAASLATQARQLTATYAEDNKGLSLIAVPLHQARMNPLRRAAWLRAGGLLAAVVGLVLLIACANVANLLLTRSATRRREISLRRAIGASRVQVMSQVLTESGMLALAGAAIGLVIAWGSLQLLPLIRPPFIPATLAIRVDRWTILFATLVALMSTIAFGLGPALHVARDDLMGGLRGDRRLLPSVSWMGFSRALVMVQSILATVALILAALFIRSLRNAQTIDPGFEHENLALVSVDLGMLRYDNSRGPAFVRQVNERLASIPGVQASAVSSHVVLDGPGLEGRIRIAGAVAAEAPSVHAQAVGPDYFRTMGIRVLEGRAFQASDAAPSAFGWAIVNTTMANRLWPGRSAIGQRFNVIGIPVPYVVVGVVPASQYEALGEVPSPYFYISYDQSPGLKKLTFYVRTAGSPSRLLPSIEREIRAADPRLPLAESRTMTDVLRKATWAPRAGSALLTLFGALALLLALVGTYGVTAFTVSQRQREIGIRMALGASRREVVVSVMRWTVLPALFGIAGGSVVALTGSRLVSSLLIGVVPHDPLSFAAAALILAIAALTASVVPAASALRLDPVHVLRAENV